MVEHHFGWRDAAAKKGKRVRPFLLLLVHEAAGGRWQQALPAAVAVELIHNFSLIHDDIQDRSETRRGRPTVWARWGKAQAINAGDALFAQAFAVMAPLQEAFGPQRALEAMRVLAQACVALVQGQVLDLAFETRSAVTGRFGETLGLAFQVWDDYLGIWGDPAKTGKSAADDLIAGKKTLPVLYGLQQPESAFVAARTHHPGRGPSGGPGPGGHRGQDLRSRAGREADPGGPGGPGRGPTPAPTGGSLEGPGAGIAGPGHVEGVSFAQPGGSLHLVLRSTPLERSWGQHPGERIGPPSHARRPERAQDPGEKEVRPERMAKSPFLPVFPPSVRLFSKLPGR